MSSIDAVSPLSTDGAVPSLVQPRAPAGGDAVRAEVAVAVQKAAQDAAGETALRLIEGAVGRNLDVRG